MLYKNNMITSSPTRHLLFHDCAQKVRSTTQGQPFVLQIGAMDGMQFDLLHPHLSAGGWRGILIEPIADMFEKLQQTYVLHPNLTLLNCAIADYNGTLTLQRIDPIAVEQGMIPAEALGISSAYTDRGIFAHPGFAKRFADVMAHYMHRVTTPCFTLNHILTQHQVAEIDVVVIDTEGADWMIFQQLDLLQYQPKLICIEHTSLTPEEINACLTHVKSHGYQVALCAEDAQNYLFVKGVVGPAGFEPATTPL